jgi:hypothetical protein
MIYYDLLADSYWKSARCIEWMPYGRVGIARENEMKVVMVIAR